MDIGLIIEELHSREEGYAIIDAAVKKGATITDLNALIWYLKGRIYLFKSVIGLVPDKTGFAKVRRNSQNIDTYYEYMDVAVAQIAYCEKIIKQMREAKGVKHIENRNKIRKNR